MKVFSGFHGCEGLSERDYHRTRYSHAVPQNPLTLGKSTCFFHASGFPHVKSWNSSCVVLWCEGPLKLYTDSPRLLKEFQLSGKWSGHQNMLGFGLKAENTSKIFICSDVSGLGQPRTSCSMEQVVSIRSNKCRKQWSQQTSCLICSSVQSKCYWALPCVSRLLKAFENPAPIVNQWDVMSLSMWF